MTPELAREFFSLSEDEVSRRPSPIEFELAYQARVAIDCIRFAIKMTDQSAKQPDQFQHANLQLLDALDRLESAERNFQRRFRSRSGNSNSDTRPHGLNRASTRNGIPEVSSRGAEVDRK
jgi:hypothetical protein